MDFWLCFACPAKFCELLVGDLESSMSFVEDLINQVLKGLPLITLVVTTKLDFSLSENMYSVQFHILCCVNPEETPNDLRFMRLKHTWPRHPIHILAVNVGRCVLLFGQDNMIHSKNTKQENSTMCVKYE